MTHFTSLRAIISLRLRATASITSETPSAATQARIMETFTGPAGRL